MSTYCELERLKEAHFGEVCIFGAGMIGSNEGYELVTAAGFQVDFYCDNYIKPGTVIRDGVAVKELQYLYDNKNNILVFLCVHLKYQKQILEQLKKYEVDNVVVADLPYIFQILNSIDSADDRIKEKYRILYDDVVYLKRKFRRKVGYELNLEKPEKFNEKIQWLKLHDHNPKYTRMVDKYEMKKYVAEVLGEEYVIPLLGCWESVDDIEWEKLPSQFVLKSTHDSGGVIICRDKNDFDFNTASERLASNLKRNYYWHGREWPYKNVKPRIIAEEYMQEVGYETINVYKVFNFNGNPKLIQVIQDDKTEKETIDYFDTEWNKLELRQNFPNSEKSLPCPKQLKEILLYAKKLSQGIPFVRTDFYIINNRIYISEFTFYSDGGMATFYPNEWDGILGGYLRLPCEK